MTSASNVRATSGQAALEMYRLQQNNLCRQRLQPYKPKGVQPASVIHRLLIKAC